MSVKEQQRNLNREVGRQAAEAIQKAEATAQQLVMQHRVLAAQMLDFEKTVATVRVARATDHNRLERLREEIYQSMNRRAQVANDGFELVHSRLYHFENMTLWQRLRWTLTGTVPPQPRILAPAPAVPAVDASPAPAYSGDSR